MYGAELYSQDMDEEYEFLNIPNTIWAVFKHPYVVYPETTLSLYHQIYREWFPTSGYVQTEGAIFAHEKIWWNNSEVFIEEMFISPELQRQGYGTELIHTVEGYIKEHKLAGFTLTTNRFAPAPKFYRKNGFVDCDHVLYMGKEVL